MFGAANAIGFAFTASLIERVGDFVAADWTQMFVHWQTYALALFGVGSLFLAQNAFHAGPIAASQTTLVLVDPLASIAFGIGLYDDNLRTAGIYGPLEALSLLVMFVGAASLAHSRLISGMKGDDERFSEMLSLRSRSRRLVEAVQGRCPRAAGPASPEVVEQLPARRSSTSARSNAGPGCRRPGPEPRGRQTGGKDEASDDLDSVPATQSDPRKGQAGSVEVLAHYLPNSIRSRRTTSGGERASPSGPT